MCLEILTKTTNNKSQYFALVCYSCLAEVSPNSSLLSRIRSVANVSGLIVHVFEEPNTDEQQTTDPGSLLIDNDMLY